MSKEKKFEKRYIGHAQWWDCYVTGKTGWKSKKDAIAEVRKLKQACANCKQCKVVTIMTMMEM